MMGGDINVESEKGKGSTFSFSIKVKKIVSEEDNKTEEKTEKAEEKRSIHLITAEVFSSMKKRKKIIFINLAQRKI